MIIDLPIIVDPEHHHKVTKMMKSGELSNYQKRPTKRMKLKETNKQIINEHMIIVVIKMISMLDLVLKSLPLELVKEVAIKRMKK